MKSIVVFAVVLALGAGAVSAKTVTSSQKDNDRVVAGVSGATPDKNKAQADGSTAQPSKKELKKTKIKTPPPMHDPN